MASRSELLQELSEASREYIREERERLENEDAFLAAVQDSVSSDAQVRSSNTNVAQGRLVDEVNQFLRGNR